VGDLVAIKNLARQVVHGIVAGEMDGVARRTGQLRRKSRRSPRQWREGRKAEEGGVGGVQYSILSNLAQIPIIFDMAQMNVSLPEGLKAWAEARVAEGLYSSTSDYVRDLMRRDMSRIRQEAEDVERLRAAWEEGLASGPAEDAPADWADQVVARNLRGILRTRCKSGIAIE